MTRIVVLANSWKRHDFCIAGIDLDSGKWVRPVTRLDDGRVPADQMKLRGRVPALLDVIEIPLDSSGRDFGFESENRWLLPGAWRHVGVETPESITRFAIEPGLILHNRGRSVSPEMLQAMPFEERITLQLVRVDNFAVRDNTGDETYLGRRRWSGRIKCGGSEFEANITDPVYHAKLSEGHRPAPSCLLTMSLSMPWPKDAPKCWKLIAGVIELPS
jgi:hypothetical protein